MNISFKYGLESLKIMNEKMVHIFLITASQQQMIEIQVSEAASFHDIISALNEMNRMDLDCTNVLVYERENCLLCDMDVSLYSLNVTNGMVFEVY